MKDYLKFWIKRCVSMVRQLLLFFSAPVNRRGWENRILIVNLDLIGDIVALSSVLQYYREAFPGKKLFMLLSRSVHPLFVRDFVDEVIQVDPGAFKSNPWYGYRFINKMRRIGFWTVIDQNPGTEFIEKSLVVELGAEELIGYQGWSIDFKEPFSINMALGAAYFEHNLLPRFTKVIPRINEVPNAPRLRHMIAHYSAIFEGATGIKKSAYVPHIPKTLESDARVGDLLSANCIAPNSYAVVSLGTSSIKKDWPVERFNKVGEWMRSQRIPIILTGSPMDASRAAVFESALGGGVFNMVGKTDISELVSLIRSALLVFSNDTALTHIAVALGKPSLTILGMGHFGRMSLYGHSEINHWVYRADASCRCDNMQCMSTVGPTQPAPCIQSVSVEQVLGELQKLVTYVQRNGGHPHDAFRIEFSI